MFNIFKKSKKTKGEKIIIKIDGMHCTSCSISIDGELEDSDGVMSASTSYAKSTTNVEFDPSKISQEEIEKKIKKLGYSIK